MIRQKLSLLLAKQAFLQRPTNRVRYGHPLLAHRALGADRAIGAESSPTRGSLRKKLPTTRNSSQSAQQTLDCRLSMPRQILSPARHSSHSPCSTLCLLLRIWTIGRPSLGRLMGILKRQLGARISIGTRRNATCRTTSPITTYGLQATDPMSWQVVAPIPVLPAEHLYSRFCELLRAEQGYHFPANFRAIHVRRYAVPTKELSFWFHSTSGRGAEQPSGLARV